MVVLLGLALRAGAQIDPYPRDLIQMGYDQPFEGRSPLGAYAFYYHNQPDFLRTNITLRLAVAPVYLDSEVGFTGLLGPNTDVGVGLAGGGYADGYSEVRRGKYYQEESFDGNGVEMSGSLYHLFNPGELIPLNFVLRGSAHYSEYVADDTAPNFTLPGDRTTFNLRTGLRLGGIEPTLFPALAMEISVWYQGEYRTAYGPYGFYNNGSYDRTVEEQSHLFWSRASFSYTLPHSQQSFEATLQAGTSIDADRFSAYRLGGFLPLVAEFPLSLPGYYYQEISARQYVLFNADYLVPLDPGKRWNLNVDAATAVVDYLPGLGQPAAWAGVFCTRPSPTGGKWCWTTVTGSTPSGPAAGAPAVWTSSCRLTWINSAARPFIRCNPACGAGGGVSLAIERAGHGFILAGRGRNVSVLPTSA